MSGMRPPGFIPSKGFLKTNKCNKGSIKCVSFFGDLESLQSVLKNVNMQQPTALYHLVAVLGAKLTAVCCPKLHLSVGMICPCTDQLVPPSSDESRSKGWRSRWRSWPTALNPGRWEAWHSKTETWKWLLLYIWAHTAMTVAGDILYCNGCDSDFIELATSKIIDIFRMSWNSGIVHLIKYYSILCVIRARS